MKKAILTAIWMSSVISLIYFVFMNILDLWSTYVSVIVMGNNELNSWFKCLIHCGQFDFVILFKVLLILVFLFIVLSGYLACKYEELFCKYEKHKENKYLILLPIISTIIILLSSIDLTSAVYTNMILIGVI